MNHSAGQRPAPEPMGAQAWLDVEAIARLTGWTPAYVRKRSSLDKWRRYGSKPQRYHVDDVTESAGTTRDTRLRTHLLSKYA